MYWHLHPPCGMLPSNTTSHPHGFAIDGPVTSKVFGGHNRLRVGWPCWVFRGYLPPSALPNPPVSPHSNLRELQKCQRWTLTWKVEAFGLDSNPGSFTFWQQAYLEKAFFVVSGWTQVGTPKSGWTHHPRSAHHSLTLPYSQPHGLTKWRNGIGDEREVCLDRDNGGKGLEIPMKSKQD